eukprot:scaffold123163_cov42-Phaeocystis_antarctica.AAC.1
MTSSKVLGMERPSRLRFYKNQVSATKGKPLASRLAPRGRRVLRREARGARASRLEPRPSRLGGLEARGARKLIYGN